MPSLRSKSEKEKNARRKAKLKIVENKIKMDEKLSRAMVELPNRPSIAEYLAFKHKRIRF